MKANIQSSDRPFEFLTIYGSTLLLVLAGTFLWKLTPGSSMFRPAVCSEQVEVFASEDFEDARPACSVNILRDFWMKALVKR